MCRPIIPKISAQKWGLRRERLWQHRRVFSRVLFFLGSHYFYGLFAISVLLPQEGPAWANGLDKNPRQNTGQTALTQQSQAPGELQWLEETPDYGIVEKHRGWFRLEVQDCARPRKIQAGAAKDRCDENPEAKQVQEYYLHFAYMPDKDAREFPFGIGLDFTLRLDRLQVAESGNFLWQIELSSRPQKSGLLLYKRNLNPAELAKTGSYQEGLPGDSGEPNEEFVENLQREQERLAYQFLQEYILCLRQGKESCDSTLQNYEKD